MPKISKKVKEWRSRQKPGAIMRPSTFRKIERKAKGSGATDPQKVAGAAYWGTVEAKARKKSGKGDHSTAKPL